ncbi:hypothetical protein ACHQM5_011382 [Ranunculus cassubicifolius]
MRYKADAELFLVSKNSNFAFGFSSAENTVTVPSILSVGQIKPGFRASQMLYIDNSGLFLVSNNSNFAFGFSSSEKDVTYPIWQFIFSTNTDSNATWSAVLDNTGVISFYNLESGKTTSAESIQIPKESCSRPEFCGSYYVCSDPSRCQCSSVLASRPNCSPGFTTSCNRSNAPMELIDAGAGNNYFALDFVSPFSKSGDLNGCKDACLKNCSCVVLFFDASSRKCYLFDHVGSFQQSTKNSAGLVSYIKVSGNECS